MTATLKAPIRKRKRPANCTQRRPADEYPRLRIFDPGEDSEESTQTPVVAKSLADEPPPAERGHAPPTPEPRPSSGPVESPTPSPEPQTPAQPIVSASTHAAPDFGFPLHFLKAKHSQRLPEWRFELAQRLADNPQSVLWRFTDENVRKAVRFLNLRKQTPAAEQLLVADQFSDLFECFALAEASKPHPMLWTIKALVLARATPKSIAQFTGTPASLVRTIETTLFDVRDRLNCRSFVVNRVIGLHEPDSSPSDRRWKDILHLAYAYGEAFVKPFILNVDLNLGRPNTLQEVNTWLQQDIIGTLRRKACLAMRNLPLDNPKVVKRLLQLQLQTRQASQQADAQREIEERSLEEGKAAFRESLRKSCEDPDYYALWNSPGNPLNPVAEVKCQTKPERTAVSDKPASAGMGDNGIL